jgi:hypothetical protein
MKRDCGVLCFPFESHRPHFPELRVRSCDTGGLFTGVSPEPAVTGTAPASGQATGVTGVSDERAVRTARTTIDLVLAGPAPRCASGEQVPDDSTLMMLLRGHLMELLPSLLSLPGHSAELVESARRRRDEPNLDDPADFRVQLEELARLTKVIIKKLQERQHGQLIDDT